MHVSEGMKGHGQAGGVFEFQAVPIINDGIALTLEAAFYRTYALMTLASFGRRCSSPFAKLSTKAPTVSLRNL